jgi:O-antigen/teichoic acid export membrane protein
LSASASAAPEADRGAPSGGYGRGARVLSVGIGITGLVTYAYFGLADRALSRSEYGEITLLWSALYVAVSVLYRPVEQLLSRTIAERDARGASGTAHLRVAATIQLGLGAVFLIAALLLRGPIEDDLFGGSATLYWVLVVAVLAYAASYFARGFLAGGRRFGLYGGLVLMESVSRCLFPLAVVVGVAEGQEIVALGMVAAPLVSLAVVPWALGRGRRGPPAAGADGGGAADAEVTIASSAEPAAAPPPLAPEPSGTDRAEAPAGDVEFTLARGGGFATAVLLIMLAEQTFLNAGPLLVAATEGAAGAALAGLAFNALLIARAPLQLFQAVQTSILPHLTRLSTAGDTDPFRRSVNLTLAAVAGFSALVALGLLAVGPLAMELLFGGDAEYERVGLVLVGIGMGLYLASATLNQAALARGHARGAAGCWVVSAAVFVAFLLAVPIDDRVLQVEIGFAGGALVLCALLGALYRRA